MNQISKPPISRLSRRIGESGVGNSTKAWRRNRAMVSHGLGVFMKLGLPLAMIFHLHLSQHAVDHLRAEPQALSRIEKLLDP
ncbi:MAG: hypothetical protein ACRESN_19990, partial [Pseudomonas sp.]